MNPEQQFVMRLAFILALMMIVMMAMALWTERAEAVTQLEGLYAQELSRQEVQEKKERLQDPRTYLYWYGAKEGLELWEVQRLDRTIECESHWVTTASNPTSTAKGLGQFLDSSWKAWGEGNVYNPYDNIRATIKYYTHAGFRPWVCN